MGIIINRLAQMCWPDDIHFHRLHQVTSPLRACMRAAVVAVEFVFHDEQGNEKCFSSGSSLDVFPSFSEIVEILKD